MLVEPRDHFLLGLVAGLVVDAVVLDAFDGDQLLDAGGAVVGADRVFLVIEQLFFLRDDEQLRATLAARDVLDRRIADELLDHRGTR